MFRIASRWQLIGLFSLFLCTMAVYSLGRRWFSETDGFSPSAIAGEFPFNPAYEVGSLTGEEQELLSRLLSQKYTYMAKGTQSYVLLSDDGEYVLKFFKRKHLDFPWWQRPLAYLPFFGNSVAQSQIRRAQKRERIFSGVLLAYQKMRADTGIDYIHLNPTVHLLPTIEIADKRGELHEIDLNPTSFYFQKRGESLYAALRRFKAADDVDGAAAALQDLLNYLVARSQRGILDRDPNYVNNVGFINGRASTLDVGNLTFDPLIRNPREYSRRIADHMVAVERWIGLNFPQLLPRFKKMLAPFQVGY